MIRLDDKSLMTLHLWFHIEWVGQWEALKRWHGHRRSEHHECEHQAPSTMNASRAPRMHCQCAYLRREKTSGNSANSWLSCTNGPISQLGGRLAFCIKKNGGLFGQPPWGRKVPMVGMRNAQLLLPSVHMHSSSRFHVPYNKWQYRVFLLVGACGLNTLTSM